jgi:hypothetical protein
MGDSNPAAVARVVVIPFNTPANLKDGGKFQLHEMINAKNLMITNHG